ncbi:hypothetical protein P8C59_000596 [Phyllachora maydis]|uniref:TOG domain-containing protein n=1 Tax=Phyllachora maydis TaxID=1825666 RepID=A0AAD9M7U2_9PEZI|nr:hypothetical protein P8C59_000596 [Phyllachora maydis]
MLHRDHFKVINTRRDTKGSKLVRQDRAGSHPRCGNMAEKINEEQVADLVAILRTDAAVDAKIQQLNAIKSGIKQHNVPETCVASLFDALRAASSSQHAILVNAGFTALNHLLTRLSRQEPKLLAKEAARTLPVIIEKLGDQKEKLRTLAMQSLITLYKMAPMEVERSVRNAAMVGKNPRAKEASMQWLLQMHQENGLQFRSYVPSLMELLEDADGMVRDTAKSTVIELFRNGPNAAKSDLKRQLKNFKVRPAIEQAIVKELVPNSSGASAHQDVPDEAPPPSRPNFAASVSSLASERPITPMLDAPADTVEPMYVNTQRELDDIFREMHVYFEGRETEQNWLKREESIIKLRKLLAGNAATDFQESFLGGVRALLDGVIKGVSTLRTSLSKESCTLVQEIARTYGPAMDPMVELLMQTFIKLAAATKKISSQQANTTVDTIIGKVTEKMRATYWTFAGIWPARAEAILNGLDPTAQKLLQNDANNPNASRRPEEGGARPGMGLSKSTMGGSKPSLREAMMAQKKALAPRNLPARPVLSPGGTPKLRPSPVKMAPGPSKIHDDLALVTPSVANSNASSPKALTSPISAKAEETRHLTPTKTVQVYEDPVTEEGRTTPNPEFTGSVLEDKAVNEAAAQVQHPTEENGIITSPPSSPERMKQNVRLLESGIAKVRAQSLDVHGFRKLQSIIRDNKAVFTDDTFKALLTGLFAYLECPLVQLTPEKSQDVKAQILATIRLLRKKLCDNFQPHVSAGLESLLRARAVYDSRTHIVAGLELLADELVALGDASDMALVLSRATADLAADSDDARGRRSLSMGLHVLKELVDTRGGDEPGAFVLSDEELATMAALAARCLDAADSGVRMDAVQLCVALHARVGGARFWAALQGVKDDPKNLITYYIAKRQREVPVPVPAAA